MHTHICPIMLQLLLPFCHILVLCVGMHTLPDMAGHAFYSLSSGF